MISIQAQTPKPITFSGLADASAGVGLDAITFVVAGDEDNALRIYTTAGGPPISQLDLSAFLRIDPRKPEADIEGAAQVGETVYWISSFGRNKDGEHRPSRERFFATTIHRDDGKFALKPVGEPYTRFLSDMIEWGVAHKIKIHQAAAKPAKAKDGLNIEGMVAQLDGTLLIGFRNPLKKGKALLVPLKNPAEMIRGKKSVLGDPIFLDLNGLGIRDLAHAPSGIFVVAGPYDSEGEFALFHWAGTLTKLPVTLPQGFKPEALFSLVEAKKYFCLSDDGAMKKGGKAQKELPLPQQTFRGVEIILD